MLENVPKTSDRAGSETGVSDTGFGHCRLGVSHHPPARLRNGRLSEGRAGVTVLVSGRIPSISRVIATALRPSESPNTGDALVPRGRPFGIGSSSQRPVAARLRLDTSRAPTDWVLSSDQPSPNACAPCSASATIPAPTACPLPLTAAGVRPLHRDAHECANSHWVNRQDLTSLRRVGASADRRL